MELQHGRSLILDFRENFFYKERADEYPMWLVASP